MSPAPAASCSDSPARGLHRVHFLVSDDHPGLKAALAACLPQALWQRCQFHLMQNAMAYVPRKDRRKEVAPPNSARSSTQPVQIARSELSDVGPEG